MTKKVNGILVIECEEPQLCEVCGEEKETRPYGKDGTEICFDCAHLPENIEHTIKSAKAVFDTATAIIINADR